MNTFSFINLRLVLLASSIDWTDLCNLPSILDIELDYMYMYIQYNNIQYNIYTCTMYVYECITVKHFNMEHPWNKDTSMYMYMIYNGISNTKLPYELRTPLNLNQDQDIMIYPMVSTVKEFHL